MSASFRSEYEEFIERARQKGVLTEAARLILWAGSPKPSRWASSPTASSRRSKKSSGSTASVTCATWILP